MQFFRLLAVIESK